MSNNEKKIFSINPVDWIIRAEMDIESAKYLYESMYPKPLEVIGGLCQQCAEKSVKGVFLALEDYKQPYAKIHDIAKLLDMIKNYVHETKDMNDKGAFLTLFKTQQSYPSRIDISEPDIKLGLEYADEIHQWAKEVVYHRKHIIDHNNTFSR